MKKINICILMIICLLGFKQSFSQCTPIDCYASLPAYGGLCDTSIANGRVGVPYSDFVSFVITDNCFDAGLINPSFAGTNIKITNIDGFGFYNMPGGLSGATNASSYSPPSGGHIAGCGSISGTPIHVGVFRDSISFLADVRTCTTIPITLNDNAAGYTFLMTILPNPAFSGLDSTYCETDAAVTLTATGTTGGVFSGPGVSGATFDPSIAGPGTHIIKYKVSAMQGAAIAPATDSVMKTVVVLSASNTYYADSDGDGYGNAAVTVNACYPPTGYVSNNTDCNDSLASVHPGATEIPGNGIDEDCDGSDAAIDNDHDGYDNTVDCNDADSSIHPGAVEICDGIDNNCDGNIDEGLTIYRYYQDADLDGYGNLAVFVSTCSTIPPMGYVADSADCDDSNGTINPGASELCDGIDNNCNGSIDEGLPIYNFYRDSDGDGYGDAADKVSLCLNTAPTGYITDSTDCDDANAAINPAAVDIPNNGIDEDCSGSDSIYIFITEVGNLKDLEVYPNPTGGLVNIQSKISNKLLVQLYDANGKLIEEKQYEHAHDIVLDMSNRSQGIYTLRVTNENGDIASIQLAKQ